MLFLTAFSVGSYETAADDFVAPLPPAPKSLVATSTPAVDVLGLINHYADLYGVSSEVMYVVVKCETGNTFDPSVQSFIWDDKGVREDSWGLAQINKKYWPGITRDQAKNPDFALNFLAEHLANHEGYFWACYNIHYGVK